MPCTESVLVYDSSRFSTVLFSHAGPYRGVRSRIIKNNLGVRRQSNVPDYDRVVVLTSTSSRFGLIVISRPDCYITALNGLSHRVTGPS